jgi:general secretion pathway protein L
MIALDTPITPPLIGQLVRRGWNWWIGELKQTIPASLMQRLRPPRPQVDIYVSPTEAIISQRTGQGWKERGRVNLLGGAEAEFSGDEIAITAPKPDAHVRLASALVLRRELELPRAAEVRLRDVVALDFDRQTPLTAETGVFDVVVRERDPAAGRIRVSLVAVKRRTIDDIVAACHQLGLRLESIRVAAASGGAAEFDLLPKAATSGGRSAWRHPRSLAAAAIAFLIVLNLGLASHRQEERLHRLSVELTKTRKASQATDKLRSQLEMSQAETRLLLESQAQAGPLEMLQELTRLLPDDVWLFGLEMRNGSVRIAGLAPSASDLIGRLDKSDVFANPRFTAAVTRADKPGNERFEITLDLRGRGTK